MDSRRFSVVLDLAVVAVAETVYAGGSKRTAETCVDDSECERGHCHTKEDGNKVCADCSSSKISDTRRQIKAFCKDSQTYPRKCDVIPGKFEAAEQFFKVRVRIENGDKCVAARKEENSSCCNGANQGHREAVDEAERGRANYCSSYENACNEWSRDDKQVNCNDIESAMQKTDKCARRREARQ